MYARLYFLNVWELLLLIHTLIAGWMDLWCGNIINLSSLLHFSGYFLLIFFFCSNVETHLWKKIIFNGMNENEWFKEQKKKNRKVLITKELFQAIFSTCWWYFNSNGLDEVHVRIFLEKFEIFILSQKFITLSKKISEKISNFFKFF